jgi:hypothetical protein
MFSINISSDMQRLSALDRFQPSRNVFLPNKVERILVEVERASLVLCFQGTRDRFEENVLEEKGEDESGPPSLPSGFWTLGETNN